MLVFSRCRYTFIYPLRLVPVSVLEPPPSEFVGIFLYTLEEVRILFVN